MKAIICIVISMCFNSCVSNTITTKENTLSDVVSTVLKYNPSDTAYSKYYEQGVLFADTVVANVSWKLEWLPNNFIKCLIDSAGKTMSDSIEFDILSDGSLIFGFHNLINQANSKNKEIKSNILCFINSNVALVGIPNGPSGLSTIYFFYIKRDGLKVMIKRINVDEVRVSGVIIDNKLILTDEDYSKNDTTYARQIFVYHLNTRYKEGDKSPILREEQYIVTNSNGGEFFFEYSDEAIYKFVTYHLAKSSRTATKIY